MHNAYMHFFSIRSQTLYTLTNSEFGLRNGSSALTATLSRCESHWEFTHRMTCLQWYSILAFSVKRCDLFQFLHSLSLWCKFGPPHDPMSIYQCIPIHSRPCSQKSIAWIVVCVVLSLFERSGWTPPLAVTKICEADAVQGQSYETRKQNTWAVKNDIYLRLFLYKFPLV